MRNLIASAVLLLVVAVSGCGGLDQRAPAGAVAQDEVASYLRDEAEQHAAPVAPAELSGDPDDWAPQATPQR